MSSSASMASDAELSAHHALTSYAALWSSLKTPR